MHFIVCQSMGQTGKYMVFFKHEQQEFQYLAFYFPLFFLSFHLLIIHKFCAFKLTSNSSANNYCSCSGHQVKPRDTKNLFWFCGSAFSYVLNKDNMCHSLYFVLLFLPPSLDPHILKFQYGNLIVWGVLCSLWLMSCAFE